VFKNMGQTPIKVRIYTRQWTGEDYVTTYRTSHTTLGNEIENYAFNFSSDEESGPEVFLTVASPEDGHTVEKVGASYVMRPGGVAETERPLWNGTMGRAADNPRPAIFTFGASTNPDGNKPIWELDDATLTAGLYREGVDKIVAAVASGGGGAGQGTSGGGGEPATGDPAVDSYRESVAYRQDALIYGAGISVDGGTGELSISNTDRLTGTSADAVAHVENMKKKVADSRNIKAFSGNTTGYTDTPAANDYIMALPGTGLEINFDPLSNPQVATLCTFIRKLIAWVVVLLFECWLWAYFTQFMRDIIHSQQAKGNAVLGGTGGQATALLAAVAITAAILGAPAAFWLLADNMGGLQSIAVNPLELSGAPAYAVHLFNCVIPVATLVTVCVTYFIVRKGALILFVGVSTVIRFVIP